jgi:hypothetical protein
VLGAGACLCALLCEPEIWALGLGIYVARACVYVALWGLVFMLRDEVTSPRLGAGLWGLVFALWVRAMVLAQWCWVRAMVLAVGVARAALCVVAGVLNRC